MRQLGGCGCSQSVMHTCSRLYTEELFGDDPAAVGVLDTTVKLQPRKGMKKKDLGEIRVMLMYAPL